MKNLVFAKNIVFYQNFSHSHKIFTITSQISFTKVKNIDMFPDFRESKGYISIFFATKIAQNIL